MPHYQDRLLAQLFKVIHLAELQIEIQPGQPALPDDATDFQLVAKATRTRLTYTCDPQFADSLAWIDPLSLNVATRWDYSCRISYLPILIGPEALQQAVTRIVHSATYSPTLSAMEPISTPSTSLIPCPPIPLLSKGLGYCTPPNYSLNLSHSRRASLLILLPYLPNSNPLVSPSSPVIIGSLSPVTSTGSTGTTSTMPSSSHCSRQEPKSSLI